MVQHGDPVGQVEHDVHVVLDHEHAAAGARGQRPDHLGQRGHVLGAHPGHRLVEQQHLRFAGQHEGDLELPFLAVREILRFAGCAIGEVLGMVIGPATGLHNAATVVLSIVLAFIFGYGLTMRGVMRAGVGLRQALTVALAADTVSIAVMELLDNAVIVAVPGAMNAGLTTLLFWGSLAFSLIVAFLVTTPVNRWMISRGKGHAVVHAYHS